MEYVNPSVMSALAIGFLVGILLMHYQYSIKPIRKATKEIRQHLKREYCAGSEHTYPRQSIKEWGVFGASLTRLIYHYLYGSMDLATTASEVILCVEVTRLGIRVTSSNADTERFFMHRDTGRALAYVRELRVAFLNQKKIA